MPQIRQMGYGSAVAVSSPIVQMAADIRCLLTRHSAGFGRALRCREAPPATAVVIVIGLNREDVEWANNRSNNTCVGKRGGALSPTGPFK